MKMKMIWLSQPLLIILCSICFPPVYSFLHCSQHDQSTMLRLKRSLVFGSDGSFRVRINRGLVFHSHGFPNVVESWNSTSDCCAWGGVTCSPRGDVVDLHLSWQSISGGVDPLFDLHHLHTLDLSYNKFNGNPIPSAIGRLVHLRHLNLSRSGFGGQVPIEISSLTALLTLKLFSGDFAGSTTVPLNLENPKFSTVIKNLKNLTELNLGEVNMSVEGHQWGHALSSSLPNLQVLRLYGCSLSGPLHDSLVNLHALTSIDLGGNNLSTWLPDFLANFSNLTSLRLSDCGLYGYFPRVLTRMLPLQYLGLSGNKLLSGTLPEGIGNMMSLTDLWLEDCGFSGSITHIHWENLESLVNLHISGNELSGSVPMSLFSLPSILVLELSSNRFGGQLGEVDNAKLEVLDLSGNMIEGPIPAFILNLGSLVVLGVSNNNFSGVIDLANLFQSLGNISTLDLSFNSLSIIQTSSILTVPQFLTVNLASCNLKMFPSFLRNQSSLDSLDLSQNKISGQVPNWIWKTIVYSIDLSDNLLIGFERLLPNLTSPLVFLNLKSNLLQGQIPIEFGNYFPNITFLSLSSNNLQGTIPYSFCNFITDYETSFVTDLPNIVIDLSSNSLSGTIPPCLLAINLGVLNLKQNNLRGNIPNAFLSNCSFETLDLSENQLQGTIPESMVNCKALKVINLGNNQLSGEFPCWLIHTSNLTVLVLRSNRFYGQVRCALSTEVTNSWPKLQIIDISANNFGGELPHTSFTNWTAMILQTDIVQPKLDYLMYGGYYHDTVTIINKGNFMELVKILTVFNAIDLSCNQFEGSIPQSIGDLKSLYALNLSHNHFTGSIPPSIGNLKAMESLDFANNSLIGIIPEQLASLTFLSYLNLSFNHLVGRIPTSTQLQSFSEWSYMGNNGLYGPPLEIKCENGCEPPPLDPISAHVGNEVDWKLICAAIGYAVGLASVIGSLMFWKRWNVYFFENVDRAMFKVFPSLDPQKRNHGKRVNRTSHRSHQQSDQTSFVSYENLDKLMQVQGISQTR